jgi:hypothetical protein
MKLRPLETLTVVAKLWGVSRRCAKRRLRTYHERILQKTNGEIDLLVRSSDISNIFVDMAVVKRFIPSLAYDSDDKDPVQEMRRELQDVAEDINEIKMRLSA